MVGGVMRQNAFGLAVNPAWLQMAWKILGLVTVTQLCCAAFPRSAGSTKAPTAHTLHPLQSEQTRGKEPESLTGNSNRKQRRVLSAGEEENDLSDHAGQRERERTNPI